MRRNYIREKKIICGDSYMAVCLYAITPQERNTRGKKQKKSGERQKARNKMSSLRKKQRKVVANFTKNGFFLSGTFEEVFLPDDFLGCVRETKNYKRRVIAAICKRFKIAREKIKMMLWAVRKGRQLVNQEDLLVSFETVIAGTEKKNTVLTDMEKRLVAYHEVGHALVAALDGLEKGESI